VQTLREAVSDSVASPRFQTVVFGSYSAFATLLVISGVYALVSHAVAGRTHEIGVRVALGARTAEVVRHIVWIGASAAVAGVVTGIFVSLALGRFLASMLFEITPADPPTLIAAATALVLVAVAAAWLPARRAARVDPLVSLRAE
jgi:ABC-type antimicrobial peptide transport system permease subunit